MPSVDLFILNTSWMERYNDCLLKGSPFGRAPPQGGERVSYSLKNPLSRVPLRLPRSGSLSISNINSHLSYYFYYISKQQSNQVGYPRNAQNIFMYSKTIPLFFSFEYGIINAQAKFSDNNENETLQYFKRNGW